ncbi:hypothetical protein BES08_20155 (plasmid) [Novosphingobium resinovorum]|uniref:Uncharacterized protein n=1 Tax=Novosphingobium resinovorum TaxID=158500 RepID=A0A1D8AAR9_9SPHN|nr:hypothetical protein BES08_20155 [Novosphingobium resinovorum]
MRRFGNTGAGSAAAFAASFTGSEEGAATEEAGACRTSVFDAALRWFGFGVAADFVFAAGLGFTGADAGSLEGLRSALTSAEVGLGIAELPAAASRFPNPIFSAISRRRAANDGATIG